MPQEPFYELMQGYQRDVDRQCIQNENDLIEYAAMVSGNASIMVTWVLCHKSNQWPHKMGSKYGIMLENARKTGTVSFNESKQFKLKIIEISALTYIYAGTSNL